jgi:hypothetical protein
MIQLPPDFKEFSKRLNSRRAEYLLIGGYAVAFHGYPRPTGGMDIWVARTPENAAHIAETLVDFGFRPDEVPPALFTEPDKVVRIGVPPLRLEIITGVSGVEFEPCWTRRCAAVLDGVPVNVIGLEDLKANKKASGRHRDLDDLEQLP